MSLSNSPTPSSLVLFIFHPLSNNVPQWSVLGPLFFCLYTDFLKVLIPCHTSVYSKDSQVSVSNPYLSYLLKSPLGWLYNNTYYLPSQQRQITNFKRKIFAIFLFKSHSITSIPDIQAWDSEVTSDLFLKLWVAGHRELLKRKEINWTIWDLYGIWLGMCIYQTGFAPLNSTVMF